MRAVLTASAALALGLSAVACGADDPDPAARPDRSAQPAPAFGGVQHRLPRGQELRNVGELYEHVRITRCDSSPDGVVVSGLAANPTKRTAGFRVVVLFTDAQARAVDSAVARVSVRPGTEGSWRASRSFEPPRGVRCVVRAVRPE